MRILFPVILCLLAGCVNDSAPTDEAVNQAEKKPFRPESTDEIGEFKGDKQVVDTKVKVTNPVTGPLEAFKPIKQQLAQLNLQHTVDLFHALEGRYPKDYDEFMQRIIKENHLKLPTPGKGFAYEYDVKNHTLVVVRTEPDNE